jgi:TPR repeat protein
MTSIRVASCGLALLLSAATAAWAGALEDGVQAYERKHYSDAFVLLRPEAERGQAQAQYFVGRMFEDGYGTERSHAEAAKWYRLSAEQGNPLAQHALSVFYAVGWAVPVDLAESLKWVRRSAEQGYYYAQSDLASRYRTGRGIGQSDLLAYVWFDLAASTAPAAVQAVLTKSRDDVGREMSPASIDQARQLAAWCRQSSFKDCE